MIYAETLAYNDTADMPGIDQVREAFIDLHGKDEWEVSRRTQCCDAAQCDRRDRSVDA